MTWNKKVVNSDAGDADHWGGDDVDSLVDQLTGVSTGETITINDPFKLDKDFHLRGDLSPAQITADQNDYAPTGHGSASVLRLNTDASRKISGLAGGVDGRVIMIVNVGAQPIRLMAEDPLSTAANRFAFGIEQRLYPDDSIALWYDSTSSRWRAFRNTNVLVITKQADETVSNSTTLQNDDDLQWSGEVNAIYNVKIIFRLDIKASSDFKYQMSVPTGAICRGSRVSQFWSGSIGAGEDTPDSVTSITTTSNFIVIHEPTGLVIMGGTAGNIMYQWAQNTAVTEDTILKAGTTAIITRTI